MDYRNIKRLSVFIMLIVILFITACSSQIPQEANQAQEEVGAVIISGLLNEEISVSLTHLKEMAAVTRDVISINSAGEENKYQAKGALLEDILKEHGKSQKDINAIRLIAGDGYAIEVPKEVLENREIILAYEMDGEPLDEKSRPVRVVVPDERAMYWVRNLAQIEILQKTQSVEVSKLYFLETMTEKVSQQDYTYYESVDKAVLVEDILKEIEAGDSQAEVHFKASDGLEKNEAYDIFAKGYIKISGKESPTFLSPDMPKGMHVKDILWLSCGENVVFTADEGVSVFTENTRGDKSGILLNDVIKEIGLGASNSYLLTAEDGFQVEIAAADIEKGLIYKNNKGKICTYFDGLPKNTTVKGILSIEIIK